MLWPKTNTNTNKLHTPKEQKEEQSTPILIIMAKIHENSSSLNALLYYEIDVISSRSSSFLALKINFHYFLAIAYCCECDNCYEQNELHYYVDIGDNDLND